VQFGFSTDTYDAEGRPTSEKCEVALDCSQLERTLDGLRGRIRQAPPPVSAKKVAGVRAYELARRNEPVALEPCEVEVHAIELLRCEGSEADLRVHCSAGTYLRSIAHDAGQVLGCGAFLKSLRRTSSGAFGIDGAWTLDQLTKLADQGRVGEALIPAAKLLPELPSADVDAPTAGFIRQGRDFRLSPFRPAPDAPLVKAVGPGGELIAIGEARLPHVYHPILVLA
jgi:tRNA pseudouridine55 synthase